MSKRRSFPWLAGTLAIVACGGRASERRDGVGSGGSAGSGARDAGAPGAGGLPPANEREAELLGPLSTSDAGIDAVSGEALVDLAAAIGLARGYAMCRCALSAGAPPPDIDAFIASCARDESGSVRSLGDESVRACVLERGSSTPGFDASLRCQARLLRDNGLDWLCRCESDAGCTTLPNPVCDNEAIAAEVLEFCTLQG